MKNLLTSIVVALGLIMPVYADSPGKGEIKTVCNDKKDKNGNVVNGKDGKPVQECKEVKVRKKLEGTEVPPNQKK